MRIVWHIMVKEFRQVMRDYRLRGMAIAAPVIQLVLLGYAANIDVKEVPMVVVDYDRGSEARDFTARFTNSGYFTIVGRPDSAKGIDEYIEHGTAWLALVIPPDFSSSVLGRRTVAVQVVADGSDGNSVNIALAYATMVVNSYSQSVVMDILEKKPSAKKPAQVSAEVRVWHNERLESKNYMVPGVVVLVLMIVTMTLTSMAVVREKELGTLEQLLVTPMKPWQLILGKLSPFVVIGMIDVTLVLAVAIHWFDVPMRGSIPLLYGMSLLFILTTLGLGLFVSTISRNQQQALMTAQFGFFIPFMYFSGFVFPIENMPAAIQYVSYLIPLRYFLEIVRGIFLKGSDLSVLWPQALALVGLGALVFGLAVLRFRDKLE